MVQLEKIIKQIHAAEQEYQRKPGSVRLLAVTKGRGIQQILAAFQQGQSAFGESYLQEALTKIKALSSYPLEWHFIGNLQANKTRLIAENFAWVHSLSRFNIAERLSSQRPAHLPPLNICVEVNVSQESSKSGINAFDLLPFCQKLIHLSHIKLRGLMVIPEKNDSFEGQRLVFRTVYNMLQLLKENGLKVDTLSMGMSGDFQAAIAEGTTMVRIGSAIFEANQF
ncbi:MAG: YggS family pyridoxal phosphate-dependent enzyme [Proteobacteria bacterium]|nr:YggS family pyridoxal phosphate-dependent enzyme [Pseudomonadota bacterium]